MNAGRQPWRDPLVVLDAAALLPDEVDVRQAHPNRFTLMIGGLVDDLASRLVTCDDLRSRLQDLADVAAAFAQALAVEPPDAEASADASGRCSEGLRSSEVEERIRYDEFFGVRRVEAIDVNMLAATEFVCVAEALADLAQTQLGVHELLALLRGMIVMTEWIPSLPPVEVVSTPREHPGGQGALVRFRLGHLVFASVCNFGHHHLRHARASLEQGGAPIHRLDLAATCVRASTAAMWYSTSLPPAMYLSVVRPLMDGASTKDHGFSGLDNFDFRRMRETWEDLVPVLTSSFTEGDAQVRLRAAAQRLYETIMEDNEHHILIAAEALGMAPSLRSERMAGVAPGADGIPAVAALRLNAEERQALLGEITQL